MANKCFIKITNQNIYDKLIAIEQKLDKQRTHIKVLYAGMAVLFAGLAIILEYSLR
jgi:hypothetical protein